MAPLVKNLPAMWEAWVQSLSWEDPLEKGTAMHSSILAWRIPWTVLYMESQRVGHHRETFSSLLENKSPVENFSNDTFKTWLIFTSFSIFKAF